MGPGYLGPSGSSGFGDGRPEEPAKYISELPKLVPSRSLEFGSGLRKLGSSDKTDFSGVVTLGEYLVCCSGAGC